MQRRGPEHAAQTSTDDTERSMCDDIESGIGDILCDALDELESVLLNEDSVLLDAEEIRPCVDKVMYLYQQRTVDQCCTFKKYATEELFAVRPAILQKIDAKREAAARARCPGSSAVFAEEAALDEELASLRELAAQVRRERERPC
eukprot:SAG31_NODE_5204_length_2678_cov_1.637069_4_plen_146_part_00